MSRPAHMRTGCLSLSYRQRKWDVAFIDWALRSQPKKKKKKANLELNQCFKPSRTADQISLYLFTMCVFSVLAFVFNQESVIKHLCDVGPYSQKG